MGGRAAGRKERRQSTRASYAHESALCAIIATNFGRAAAVDNFSMTNYEAIFFLHIIHFETVLVVLRSRYHRETDRTAPTRRTIGTRTDGLRKAPAGLPRPSRSRVSLDGTSADLRLRLQSSAKLGEWYHAPCAMILTQTAALLSGCPRNLLSLPCA